MKKHLLGIMGFAAVLTALLAVQACSPASAPMRAEAAPALMADEAMAGGSMDMEKAKAVASAPAAAPGSSSQPGVPEQGRKRIMTGVISLEVPSDGLEATVKVLTERVEAMGGYVSSSEIYSQGAEMTLRVPAARFSEAFQLTKGNGKVLRASSSAEDVTNQFYDLTGRVATKRILLERYQSYLREARKIDDLLAIEATINKLLWEIEQLEGSLKGLSDRIEYSTLSVSLSVPGKLVDDSFNLGTAMGDLGKDAKGFFQGLLMTILYCLVIGVPIVLLALAAWWLLFGRLGLLRRAFAFISPAKAAKATEAVKKTTANQ